MLTLKTYRFRRKIARAKRLPISSFRFPKCIFELMKTVLEISSMARRFTQSAIFLLVGAFASLWLCASSAWTGSSPFLIPYQGRLTHPQGVPYTMPYTNNQYTIAPSPSMINWLAVRLSGGWRSGIRVEDALVKMGEEQTRQREIEDGKRKQMSAPHLPCN